MKPYMKYWLPTMSFAIFYKVCTRYETGTSSIMFVSDVNVVRSLLELNNHRHSLNVTNTLSNRKSKKMASSVSHKPKE